MHSTEQLASLISRKHQVLVQLREMGMRQADLVAKGETALLLRLLSAKQSLIAMIREIELEMDPYHGEDPDKRRWASPEARARCAAQAAECNNILREVVLMEQHGAEKMMARRDEIATQLQQVHTAAQVRGAYESQRRQTTSSRG